MTTFEWTAIGLILFGMALPFWIMTLLTCIVLYQQQKITKPPSRPIKVHDYTKLMVAIDDLIHSKGTGSFNGPALQTYLREMKQYPEYKDTSLLYLEELSITGKSKWSEICRTEQKAVEEHLLGLKND
ncbi:hypothetical protein [Erythrobacter sp.]|uniref:hypothetical protein n=1 Tax=Erythrobacter sp. TaxID=1042 RepID=UPI001425CADB|nr:hypothetical protein [Erythrobacter sp.]QIQ86889.1 MAG: hypothetical protein G9473_09470 [Erythrobacter sp.]